MPLPELPPAVPLALFALFGAEWLLTQSRVRSLEDLPETAGDRVLPGTCLCIPARNEAAEVGPALDSWLAQDHPALRAVVVDDGSTDGTSEILAVRARAHPGRLRVIRNEGLPPGWLGKNHALSLAVAAPEARESEWLIFADADVHAEPGLLRRAFAYLEANPCDVLALIPAVDLGSFGERLALPIGSMGFLWLVPPRRVADPNSAFFCGVGACTFMRRAAYEAIGGHAADPMEAVDDMMLARRAKASGFKNRVACGGPDLHLRMYSGLWDLVRSMRKNALAFPLLSALAPLWILAILALFLSPVLLALFGWPLTGFALWLLWPAMVAEATQRITRRAVEPAWMLWPLVGPVLALGLAWAFLDRLRGVNHWRGREVKLRV
ncbi:MAG: glycosyltransferase [Acidobacteria bacterium]|nr:glycosyltransferase [Acidobacteriota bacterium]